MGHEYPRLVLAIFSRLGITHIFCQAHLTHQCLDTNISNRLDVIYSSVKFQESVQ